MDIIAKKQQLSNLVPELYADEFFTDMGGNISIKDEENSSFWITPTGIKKDKITPDQLIEISIKTGEICKNLNDLTPSVEYPMHRRIYEKKPDIECIFHAHAPYSVAYSILENPEVIPPLTSELQLLVPKIIVTPYAPSGTYELGDVVSKDIDNCDIVILKNHGTVAVSSNKDSSLVDAIIKTKALEKALQIYTIAKMMGGKITPFPN